LISDNEIKIELYEPRMIGRLRSYLKTGNILNDNTILLTEEKRAKNGKDKISINETYYYKHYLPKPDSTNKFIQ
jgi:hypothetical protein